MADTTLLEPPAPTHPLEAHRAALAALSDELAVAAHEPGTGVLEPLHRDRVVPVVGGLVADAGVHRRPVWSYVGSARQPADAPPLGQRIGRTDDHLAGDAPVVGTLAAHQPLVDPDHVEPGPRQVARHGLASGTEPDHHHVALVRHVLIKAPVRRPRPS